MRNSFSRQCENTIQIEKKTQPEALPVRVKKIPIELRRRRINLKQEPLWHKRLLLRLREDSQFLRSTIQAAFLLLCVWIGVEFYMFTRSAGSESQAYIFHRR